jgi:hypothetical protein
MQKCSSAASTHFVFDQRHCVVDTGQRQLVDDGALSDESIGCRSIDELRACQVWQKQQREGVGADEITSCWSNEHTTKQVRVAQVAQRFMQGSVDACVTGFGNFPQPDV